MISFQKKELDLKLSVEVEKKRIAELNQKSEPRQGFSQMFLRLWFTESERPVGLASAKEIIWRRQSSAALTCRSTAGLSSCSTSWQFSVLLNQYHAVQGIQRSQFPRVERAIMVSPDLWTTDKAFLGKPKKKLWDLKPPSKRWQEIHFLRSPRDRAASFYSTHVCFF